MFQVQIDKLADSDAGSVQQLQHSLVSTALGVPRIRLFKKKLDLLAGKDLGQFTLYLFQNQTLGRVQRNKPLPYHVRIKRFQRGQRTSDR